MTLIKVDPVDDSLDRLVNRCVFKHNIGSFTAQLQRQALFGSRQGPLDDFADFRTAREGNFIHIRVIDDRCANGAVPGDDVDDSRGQFGLLKNLRQLHCR